MGKERMVNIDIDSSVCLSLGFSLSVLKRVRWSR